MNYDVVLKEKPDTDGLEKAEIIVMLGLMSDFEQVVPVEYSNINGTSTAMGFFSVKAADKLDFRISDSEGSPFACFIGNILGDMNLESPTGEYEFEGLKIFMTR